MDIFEYIDRVKANFDKQPEPRYNTKKYFMGGRVGFDKGGMAKLTLYAKSLPKETVLTRKMVQDYVKKNKLNVNVENFFNRKAPNIKGLKVDTSFQFTDIEKNRIEKFGKSKYDKLGPEQQYQVRQDVEVGKLDLKKQQKTVFKKAYADADKFYKKLGVKMDGNIKDSIRKNIAKNNGKFVAPSSGAKIYKDATMNIVRDTFVNNVNADSKDIAKAMFGDKKFNSANATKQLEYEKDAARQISKFVELFSTGAKQKIKGFKNINPNKLGDILESIETRISDFGFETGTRRELMFSISDAKRGLEEGATSKARKNLMAPGKAVDEVAGVSATFDRAPGYIEATQVIDKNINKKKGKILDNQFSETFKKTLEGDFSGIKEYNQKANAFAKKYNVDVPIIKTGNNLNPEKIISYFKNFSPGAQENIKQIAKEKGVVIQTKSKPLFMSVTDAVEDLPEDKKIKICNRLSIGGLPGDCANAIKKDPMKTSQIIVEETKDLKTAAGAKALKAGRIILKFGVIGEGAFIGADAGIRGYMGRPKNEAFLAATFREGKADDLRKKRAGLTDREFLVDKATNLRNKISSLQQQIITSEAEGTDTGTLENRLDETMAEIEKPFDKTGTRLVDLLDPGSATNISYQRKMENIRDSDRAKSTLAKQTKDDVDMGIPNISDEIEVDTGVSKKTFAPKKTFESLRYTMLMREPDIRAGINDLYKKGTFGEPGLELTKEKAIKGYKEYLKFFTDQQNAPLSQLAEEFGAEQVYGTQGKFASGGLANLTRTIPPKKGPQSQGLASFIKNGKR